MSVQPISAGGGVLFRQEGDQLQVLMIYRRGVWDLPKGKQEENETIEECACREVAEEVGCPLPVSLGKLTETYHEYLEDGQRVGKTTHWFVMKTEPLTDFEPEQQEGIEEVRWYGLKEAKQIAGYENLVEVLNALVKYMKKGMS